jgi:hypothetical protein
LMPALPRRLLVEGKDDQHVVWNLCVSHQVPQTFEVRETEGIDPLIDVLSVQLKGSDLERIGIVIDADVELASRWASIATVLQRTGYASVPEHPLVTGTIIEQKDRPTVGVWLMPDNTTAGMLEDFAAALVRPADPLFRRAEAAVDAIPADERPFSLFHRSKAVMHTWLAWQKVPGSPLGQAIGKGDLDAHAPQALRFVAWLRRLMVDGMPDEPAEQG